MSTIEKCASCGDTVLGSGNVCGTCKRFAARQELRELRSAAKGERTMRRLALAQAYDPLRQKPAAPPAPAVDDLPDELVDDGSDDGDVFDATGRLRLAAYVVAIVVALALGFTLAAIFPAR